MAKMRLILRWHGEKDPVSLKQYAQVPNIYGIVTSLYHLPLGVEWDEAWTVKKVTLPDGTEVEEHRPDGFNGVKPVAGYGLFDRALGAAYAVGLWEGITKQKEANKKN